MARAEPRLAVREHTFDPVNLMWRVLSSRRASAVPLFLLVAAMLLASLIPQVPDEIRADSGLYADWLGEQRARFGELTSLIRATSLFEVHESWWFRGLMVWTGVSLGVALAGWAGAIHSRRAAAVPAIRLPAAPALQTRLVAPAPPLRAAQEVTACLGRLGYRLRTEAGPDVRLHAERNSWHRLATLANHAGVAIVLVAAVAGSAVGFRDDRLEVAEGSTVPLGHDTGLTLRNHDFASAWYPDVDIAADYVSDVTLYEHGRPVVERYSLRVNSPLRYKGVSIHQSYYGPAVDVRVTAADGSVLHTGGVPLVYLDDSGRPAGEVRGAAFRLWLVAPRTDGPDPVIPPGQLGAVLYQTAGGRETEVGRLKLDQGDGATMNGLTVLFERERQYSGFVVSYNPAVPFIWGGIVVMLAGLLAALYFPHRQAWVRIRTEGDLTTVQLMGGAGRRMGRRQEFDRLASALRRALSATPAAQEGK